MPPAARSSTRSTRPGVDPVGSLQDARSEAYGLARGRLDQDPTDAYLLEELRRRSGAGAGPFDATTRNALLTQAAQDAAAAESVQRGRVSGSADDPSVMAAMNEAAARRQATVQNARLGIDAQAGAANYASQGQSLGQLAGVNQAQQQMRSGSINDLIGMLSREERSTPASIPGYGQRTGSGQSGDTLAARDARNASFFAKPQVQQPARLGSTPTYRPVQQPQQQPQGNVRIIGNNATYSPYAQQQQPQQQPYGPQVNVRPRTTNLNPYA